MGFDRALHEGTDRPSYDPTGQLKLGRAYPCLPGSLGVSPGSPQSATDPTFARSVDRRRNQRQRSL